MERIEGWPGELLTLSTGRKVFARHSEPSPGGSDSDGDGATPERPAPIVYVHGLGGSSTNWTALMRELHDDAEQWALDLPGFGESPRGGRHTVAEFVADVSAFLERFDEPVHLVANSLGGMICVYVAARRPDLVRTLSLVSPAMPQYRLPWAARATAFLALPWLGERILARVNGVPPEKQAEQLAAIMFADWSVIPVPELEFAAEQRARWMNQPYAETVLLAALRSIVVQYVQPRRRSAWGAAGRILRPTLVIMGSSDSLVGPWARGRWRRTLRRSRLVYMPNTGHVAMMEHPHAVAELLRDFLHDTGESRIRTPVSSRRTAGPGMPSGVAPLAKERMNATN
ncbi:alpha/beta fold hydrolase [Jiangella asiatica]|uniref:alpha/beta fold hydrolase n=1 Tax=Jiangella asiatica TaxID=2530372 RepID=UPI0013A5D62C|nr:alpha/beta hydrolase [Jiangella asiatica]